MSKGVLNIGDFKRFRELFTDSSVKTSKKYSAQLGKDAKDWMDKYFDVVFGSTTRCDTKTKVTYHYSIGMLMLGFPGLGDYYFKFIIKMIHFEKWNLKEWRDGYKYGLYCSKSKMRLTNNNYRDGNPYTSEDFYRNAAWDAGYIMGLSRFSFSKYISR